MDYDPAIVKWVVVEGFNHYGPFDTQEWAEKWISATHAKGKCTVYPLFPGMIS